MKYNNICILVLAALLLAGLAFDVSAGASCKCGRYYGGYCNKVTRVGFSSCNICSQTCSSRYDSLLRCRWGVWKYGRCYA